MRDLFADPKVVDAVVGLILAAIAGVGGLGALAYKLARGYLEKKFSAVLETTVDARDAAQSATKEVRNNHQTNVRDDIDKAIETIWLVSDQLSQLSGAVTRTEAAVGEVKARMGRLDERMDRLDERMDRLDSNSHDAHTRQWERIDRLSDRIDELEDDPS